MSEAHRATEKTDPALSPDQEIEAMRRIAAGEHEAYAMVTALYMTDIYRYACGLLRDQAAAEDVTQETLLRLWHRASQWKPTGRIRSWLLRIAHNLCTDLLTGRRPASDLETIPAHLLPESLANPSISLQDNQLSSIVQKALETLSERQQSAVILTYYLECPNNEAASVMELSVDAFESLLSRGRAALKKELKNYKHMVMES